MSIWVLCEGAGDGYRSTTYELLSEARKLGASDGGEVVAVVVGDDAANKDRLTGLAGKVLVLAGPNLSPYESDPWVDAIASAVDEARPALVLFGEGQRTRDLLPRVAARLGVTAVTSVVGLKKEGEGYVLNRPVQGGKAYASLALGSGTSLVAFRPNSFVADAPAGLATTFEEKAVTPGAGRAPVVERVVEPGRKVDITEAQVVVCGGRGMRSPENLRLLEDLAQLLGGAKGVTRAIVDAGWEGADHSIQVGKSGKTVSPGLYFACGISGATHHIMGMDTSKVVVSINTDPSAIMFEYSDYGIAGDALEVLPLLIEEVRKAKGAA
jgi:electron transfer flavoprotein alpha subunit